MDSVITLIIKVTNSCDMHCRYCFIEPAVFHKTMARETASRIIRAFLDSTHFKEVTFVWHGGEPLLRGQAFYEHILAEERRLPTPVQYTNAIQTNATHLSNEILDFLLANDIHIGLSLDGPPALNDASRRSRQRSGGTPGTGLRGSENGAPGERLPVQPASGADASHRLSLPVVAGQSSLQEADCAESSTGFSAHAITVDAARRLSLRGQPAGAIVVVSAANVGHPEEVYWEFKRQGIHMKVNPLMKAGLAATEGSDLGISAEEYGRFLVRLFDVWYDDPDGAIAIDPFVKHIGRLLGLPGMAHECHFARSCHRSFLGISPDGNMYPCGMFQGEPDFLYGNIGELSPEDIAKTALFGKIELREQRVLEECMECAFFDLCYSGCMFHSLKNGGRFEDKDYYCAGYKMYFEHLVRRVHKDLANAVERLGERNAGGGVAVRGIEENRSMEVT
ncbi:MAG TPA: radical SAM protein [Gemmataceae bacterium]|nr:radical SAM protein [Gemmataceae bacterium]